MMCCIFSSTVNQTGRRGANTRGTPKEGKGQLRCASSPSPPLGFPLALPFPDSSLPVYGTFTNGSSGDERTGRHLLCCRRALDQWKRALPARANRGKIRSAAAVSLCEFMKICVASCVLLFSCVIIQQYSRQKFAERRNAHESRCVHFLPLSQAHRGRAL